MIRDFCMSESVQARFRVRARCFYQSKNQGFEIADRCRRQAPADEGGRGGQSPARVWWGCPDSRRVEHVAVRGGLRIAGAGPPPALPAVRPNLNERGRLTSRRLSTHGSCPPVPAASAPRAGPPPRRYGPKHHARPHFRPQPGCSSLMQSRRRAPLQGPLLGRILGSCAKCAVVQHTFAGKHTLFVLQAFLLGPTLRCISFVQYTIQGHRRPTLMCCTQHTSEP